MTAPSWPSGIPNLDGEAAARWLPLIILTVGLLLSALLWRALDAEERAQQARALASEAKALVRILETGLNERARALGRTAQRWHLAGGRTRQEFNLEAAVNQQSYPALRSIGWVDPNLIVRWVYPGAGNSAAMGLDNNHEPRRRAALLTAERSGRAAVAGPVPLAQGGRGLLLFQSISAVANRRQGFIYGAIDAEMLLRRVIGNAAPAYAIEVWVGGERAYARRAHAGAAAPAAGPATAFAFDFGGAQWTARLRSPPLPLARLSTIVPLVGLLASLGLAGAARFAVRGQRREIELRSAARASESRFRAVFENAAVGVARVGFTGAQFLEVNEALCTMLGYTREELLATAWTEITHPDDLDEDLGLFEQMAAGGLEAYAVEKRFLHKSGSYLWARLTLSLVRDATGRPDFEICVVEDISDRKAAAEALRNSEDRLRRVLDQLFVFVGITDLSGTLVEANHAPLEAAGITAAEVIGKPFWDAYWWSYDDDVQARLKDAIGRAANGEVVRYDVPVRMAGGALVTIDFQLAPLRNPGGRITHLVPSAIMIEDRVRAQAELRELADTLEQRVDERTRELAEANEELNAFAYTVSHDLRAPLRAMEGFARILLEDYSARLDDEGRRYAQRIVAAATRMESLIEDLLAYSRLSRAELHLRPVELETLVRRAVEEARGMHPDASITMDGELPRVRGEPSVLAHMIGNLIGNAVKFTKPGDTATVRVRGEAGEQRARLCVEDEGIGIAPEHQARIFNVFERLHGQEAYPGTGVGLAIVRKGAERLGGTCGVESVPGQGSRFWIELEKVEAQHA